MPGLELMGPLAAAPRQQAPGEIERGIESHGMVILGDARDAAHYSGPSPGQRWLCRVEGPLTDDVRDWPTPSNKSWRYHATPEAARAMYAKLRQHALARAPGLEAHDDRANTPLNAPGAQAEVFTQHGAVVMRLFYDQMTDLQVAVRQTRCIRRFAAHPAHEDGPALVSYSTQNDVLYLAAARGPSGAAQHVCVVYSPGHEPEPMISQGMPRAERVDGRTTRSVRIHSGLLLAFWGRLSGAELLAPAGGQDPVPMLLSYLGDRLAAPLHSSVYGLDARLGGVPAAYVLRVEPGDYQACYYELGARAGAGYSFVALSRKGSPSFQPARQHVPARNDQKLFEGACKIIELARTLPPANLVEAARGVFAAETQRAGTPAQGFAVALGILRAPGEKNNPRFHGVDQVTARLAEAHWMAMKDEDRTFEGGNEKAYIRQVIAEVYEKNGLPVPGVGGLLGRFIDKL